MNLSKKTIILSLLYLCFFNLFANDIKSIYKPIWQQKVNIFTFQTNEFEVSLNQKDWSLNPIILNKQKTIIIKPENYVEILKLIELNETKYVFWFSSLGFEQIFIYDVIDNTITEPFFDMKKEISINKIDYENQVLFGDTWNSDKGIMPDQTISLYLFSTAKQKHFKIAEKKGETFSIELLDNCKIEYKDQNGNIVQYGYSEWVNQDVCYKASSYLIEGKTLYKPDNLSSTEGLPWASANGYGINDTIQILIPACNVKQLNFYNGFQSKEKPHLYNANSRAKKISIKCLNTNKSIYINLKDSNEKQIIDLKSLGISYNTYVTLEITILEVYPGEKYKDLCIQAIIPE